MAYLRSLAEHVESGELELARLTDLSDEEVFEQLTAVKGLGQWTADMFLIFHLGRPDVLPVGDLGIRRAVEREYGLAEMPDAARAARDRRAMAAESLAGVALSLALARQRARLDTAESADPAELRMGDRVHLASNQWVAIGASTASAAAAAVRFTRSTSISPRVLSTAYTMSSAFGAQ